MATGQGPDNKAGSLQRRSDFAKLVANTDQITACLGPMETWPETLRAVISLIMNSRQPNILLVGVDAIMIYNEAYAHLLGPRHPQALGGKARECWPECSDFIDHAITKARQGEAMSEIEIEVLDPRGGLAERAWFNIDCTPLQDRKGEYLAMLIVAVEATDQVLGRRKTAMQLDRLRNMFAQAPGFLCILGPGPDYVVEYVNEAHKQLFGDRHAEGKRYVEAYRDAVEDGRSEAVFQVYATGERYVGRGNKFVLEQADGLREERFVDVVIEPLKDDSGEVAGVYIEGFDVTPQVCAQRAAEANAHRVSAAVEIAQLGTFAEDSQTGVVTYDARAREIHGFDADSPLTLAQVFQRMPPEDARRIQAATSAADAGGRVRRAFEYQLRSPDGSIRDIAGVCDTAFGPDGKAKSRIGMLADVTAQRRATRRQRMLINELNHRVKNTLATVQAIASQTFRSANDLPSAQAAFEARLMALSAIHDLLNAEGWHGARLGDIIATACAPFEPARQSKISRAGPAAWLDAPRALALSLALHELATNAVKHGSLSVPEGQVEVSWRSHLGELTLTWAEHGGPPVAPAPRSGFGTRLLQRGLARELQGEVAIDFAPDGVRCDIRFRIEDLHAESPSGPGDTASPGLNMTPVQ